jgi:hypothetical protein
MRTITKTLVTFTASLLAGLAVAGPSYATPITGSDTIGATVTSSNAPGGNLGNATQFTLGSASQRFSLAAVGSGSFSVLPVGTTVPLSSASYNLGNLASFGFTSPTVGTFTPSVISESNKTANSLDVYLSGAFVPGTLFGAGATAPLGVSELFNFIQTSPGVFAVTGTFAAPPAVNPVPEPLPISLIGLGLVGLLAFRSRRKAGSP